ncbi:hypothetical protein ICL16_21530 [Iningainema sp. BLCCT55]|uniref:Uncharacterized protein n=1 Tax=Iningainema tapete BLCC-T55 TaxID=2748662 RepID=A0A8J7BYS5_9CYAN|nr:hypothetical protein [Iningainema tapete]MBD2774573.1 hypothetical protein [Iningainema tapete BLCC-T55]
MPIICESGQKAFELRNFDTREEATIAVKERIEEIELNCRVSSIPYRDEISDRT